MSSIFDNVNVLTLLPPTRTLIYVSSTMAIDKCLDVMTLHKLSSVPVMKADTKFCLGFLDVLDFVGFCVSVANEGDITNDNIDETLSRASKFLSQTAQDVIDKKGCHPYFGINCAAKVSSAVSLMLKHSMWRLGVERGGELISVITTTDIIRYISGGGSATRPDQPIQLPRMLLARTLSDLVDAGLAPRAKVGANRGGLRTSSGGIPSGVATVDVDEPLLRCFDGMRKDDAVGVVDQDGRLYGCVSAWDLKFLNHHSLISLTQPTRLFLKTVRNAMMASANYLVTATLSSTVESLLKKFHEHHVDRLYVVDADNRPIGLVSVHDLIRALSVQIE